MELFTWERIEDLLEEYPDVRDSELKSLGGETAQRIEAGISAIQSFVSRGVEIESDALHGEIEEAKLLVQQREYQLARFVLEKLRTQKWEHMGPRHRFRLLSNLAATYLGEGNVTKASALFLEAKGFQPEDEQALANEALAYFVIGDAAKAQELTNELRKRYPYSARIHVIWIHTMPAGSTLDQVKPEIPSAVLPDGEVSAALASRALLEGRFDLAEEFASRACESKSDWSYPRGLMGQAIVLRTLGEHDVGPDQGLAAIEALRKAEKFFSEAIALATAERATESKAEALVERSVVRRILQDDAAADNDVLHAYGIAPDSPSVVRALADLEDRRGNLDKAVSLLRGAASQVSRPDLQVRLAEALAKRNLEGDRHEASELLLALSRLTVNFPFDMQKHVSARAVNSLVTEQRYEDAENFCNDLLEGHNFPGAFVNTLRARIAFAKGTVPLANEFATVAMAAVGDATDRDDVRYLAVTLGDLGRFAEALKLWKRIAKIHQLDRDTKQLMDCASRLGRDDIVLETCKTLREGGVRSHELVMYELHRLERYDIEEAIRILSEYSHDHPEDKLVRLHLSRIGIDWNRPDIVDVDPSRLPGVDEASPTIGRLVVQVLKLGGKADEALDYGYRLLRRHFSDADAHRAFMFNLHPISPRPNVKMPTEASVGSAVAYVENGEQDEHWVVIEDGTNPSEARDEYAPNHPLAVALLGRGVGDEFVIAPGTISPRRGTVRAILNKYVFRYQDCMKNWQVRFPDQPELESVKVIKHNAETNQEDVDLSAVLASVDRRQDTVRKALEAYRTQPVPVNVIAEFFRKTSFQVAGFLATEESAVVVCCDGSAAEREEALTALELNPTIVIHPTALATVRLLELENVLQLWPTRLVLSQGSLAEPYHVLSEETMFDGQSGVLTKEQGAYRLIEFSSEVKKENKERLERFIESVESACQTVGSRELASVEPEKRQNMIRAFGTSGAESIVLAARPGHVLWADDQRMARFAKLEFGVRTVWTQVVLSKMVLTGAMDVGAFAKASAKLLGWNYYFTSMSVPILMEAGRIAEWQTDKWPLKNALSQFGEQSISFRDSLMLLASFLVQLYREPVLPQTREAVAIATLETFAIRPGAMTAIGSFKKMIPVLFGLNAVGALEATQAIEAWLSSKEVVV